MPLIYQSNNKSNSLRASAIKVERKHIKDAYFAIRKDEPVYEGTPSMHTVVSGDTLSKIANNNSTTVAKIKADNGLTSDLITVGQELALSKATKKGDKVSFTKIKEAKVGEEVYIVVKTKSARELELKINIKQGVEDGVAKMDEAIIIQQEDKNTDCIKATVGDYCKEEGITNKDDFADWAIAKVVLQPKGTEKQKEWSDALDCLQDKKSKLYILVDAHSDNDYHITYHGRNPDDEGKPDYKTCPNRWLDMDEKWFELEKGCDCGKSLNVKFKCEDYSSFYGPYYGGKDEIKNYSKWDELIANGELTQAKKDILIAVMNNEGKLDSVQSYDSEVVSVGAMQKTINTQGEGEFPIQVKEFKVDFPNKYKELFEDCGWTVEGTKMYYKDPNNSYSSKITGKDLRKKIREGFDVSTLNTRIECHPLEPIVKAAKDIDFQTKQIKDAKNRMENSLNVKPVKAYSGSKKNKNITERHTYKIKEYLKSDLGRALVFDHSINRPAYPIFDLGKALNDFFTKKDNEIDKYNEDKDKNDHKSKISRNPNDWGDNHESYEETIIELYGPNRDMTHASIRYNKLKNKL